MAPPKGLAARYSPRHNIGMALVAVAMVVIAVSHFMAHPEKAPTLSFNDTRFVLFAALAVAMLTYSVLGVRRALNREPQVVIDRDGLAVGFGRDKRFTWDEVEWVRLRRLAFRPQLQVGLRPDAFVAADLRLSMWNLDDGLRPIRGVPAALLVRDNGLDARASAMLDAVKTFRPNLVKS
ncbi:MAG: hypothetical protein JSR47_10245 [Proteobacteria bacterium]|nr:hypothetical protein [Pseudomonadota bacterium]MBS0548441.1 hypothetical protein [Pseudomonadota bacterium]